MELLIRSGDNITPFKFDLVGLENSVKSISSDISQLGHAVGIYQRNMSEVTDRFTESINIIYDQYRSSSEQSILLEQRLNQITNRIAIMHTDMEVLKLDVVANTHSIVERFEHQVSEVESISNAFGELRNEYRELAQTLHTQTTSLSLRMKRVVINTPPDTRSVTLNERVGIINAFCDQEDVSIDDSISEMFECQRDILDTSASMTKNINELKHELAKLKSMLTDHSSVQRDMAAGYEVAQEQLRNIQNDAGVDSTKIDILTANYRQLAAEVDGLKLEFLALKSTSSPKPKGRISARKPREVEFTSDVS